jgi:hypothetical protein
MHVLGREIAGERVWGGVTFSVPVIASMVIGVASHYGYGIAPWVWSLYTAIVVVCAVAFFGIVLHSGWFAARKRGWGAPARLASLFFVLALSAFGIYAFITWGLVKKPPPPPQQTAKPVLGPLKYRACGVYTYDPRSKKLMSFELEIDPINPNHEGVSYTYKRWHVEFGGRMGIVLGGEGATMELAPEETVIQGVTTEPATRVSVPFNPPIHADGYMAGTYSFEFRIGPDEDNMTTPGEINGTISGTFDDDGLPTGDPVFTPSGGRNMSFDPTRCKVDLRWAAPTKI